MLSPVDQSLLHPANPLPILDNLCGQYRALSHISPRYQCGGRPECVKGDSSGFLRSDRRLEETEKQI